MFARNTQDNFTYDFYKCTIIWVIEYKGKDLQGNDKTYRKIVKQPFELPT